MSEKASLTLSNNRDELIHIATFVEEIGDRESWAFDLVFKINLVLEELGINIMDYAYDEGGHEFNIFLTSEDDAVTIEVIDEGRPFDPINDAPVVDVESSVADRRVGGLGLHLVRTTMDEMSYKREQGKNHLTLVARRS